MQEIPMDIEVCSMTLKQVQGMDGAVSEGLFFTEVPNAHVRLFRREAIDLMTGDDFQDLMSKYTQPAAQKKLRAGWEMGDNERERAKYRLFSTVSLFEEPGAIDALKAILSRDPVLRRMLHLDGLRTHKYYAKFFTETDPYKMDRIANALEPEKIAEQLRRGNCRHYEEMLERVEVYLGEKCTADAACEMLRSLPYCTDSIDSSGRDGEWYFDFLSACLKHGYTAMLPRFIDPNFKQELEEFKALKEAEARVHLKYETNLVQSDDLPTSPRPQSDYASQRVLSFEYDYEPAEYQLRPYQNELVAHANRGRNTIICAPTGSGKTLVATDIIIKHLREAKSGGQVARVVMLVPTVPLVEQQTIEFLKFMAGEFWVDGFSGAENCKSRGYTMLAADVVVSTPQILINMLNSILQEERVYLADFTMMIFDECHNCTENHPYRVLMQMVDECTIPKKPQIIGLTASLGVGQSSWDINACREHMLKMCSHLMADSISTVRHQLDNLKAHVVPPVDVVVKCKRPAYDEFLDAINKAMATIEANMKPVLWEVYSKKLLPLAEEDIAFPRRDHPDRYQSVVGALRKNLERLQHPKHRLFLIRSIDHLAHYFHAVGISDLLPNRYGLLYLDSKMKEYIKSDRPDDVTNQLIDLYRSTRKDLVKRAEDERLENKEILQKLYQILSNQYTQKPDSRTLIFVATRVCAQRLSEHLSQHLSSWKSLPAFYEKPEKVAGYMTSSNQSAISGGQSGELQRLMRARFESGELKILVVTSVADEGINIVECNLIIKYNNVGSERALIQRRGRARARDSHSILLALDSGVEAQEFLNMQKEAMMMRCIEDLQAQSDIALQKMIAEKSARLRASREEESRKDKIRRDMLSQRKYKLNCRACGVKICDSMDIRSIADTYYVCVDPEAWRRSTNEFIRRPTADGITTKCARWICKKCQEEWGQVVKFSNVYLPAVSTRAFVLERLDTQEPVAAGSNKKTWHQIRTEFFNIDSISARNIRDMHQALLYLSDADYAEMEKQEELANRLAMEKIQERKDKRALRQHDHLEE